MKLFGREPTLWIQALSLVLTFVVSFGWSGLEDKHAGAVVAATGAVFTAWNAFTVKPVAPTIFTGVIQAVGALLISYGLELPQQMLGAFQFAVIGVMALVLRSEVTPTADPAPTVLSSTPKGGEETVAGRLWD